MASNPFHDAEGILGVNMRPGSGVHNHIPSLHWPPKVSVASASSGGGGMAITHHLEREESALHSNSGISYDLPRSRPGQDKEISEKSSQNVLSPLLIRVHSVLCLSLLLGSSRSRRLSRMLSNGGNYEALRYLKASYLFHSFAVTKTRVKIYNSVALV